MADDICDWLAQEEADAEQWGGLGGARYYQKQFAAARTEIERLRDELIRTRAERDHAQVQADHLAQRLVKEARRG